MIEGDDNRFVGIKTKRLSLKEFHCLLQQINKLVEVETYNREEGNLMRFWYPVSVLEKPVSGLSRASFLAMRSDDTTQIDAQQELLRCEIELTRLYCRAAMIDALKSSGNSLEIISEQFTQP